MSGRIGLPSSGPRRRVIVCGAGVGGLTAAARLAEVGFPVRLVEARDEAAVTREGVFLTLAPNGMNGLRAVGCYEPVRRAGIATTAIELRNHAGRWLYRARQSDFESQFGSASITIRRGDLLEILIARARAAGVELSFESRVQRVVQSPGDGGAHVELSDHSVQAADILVGADGLRSVVRRTAFPEYPAPRFSGRVGTGGITDADVPDTGGAMRMTFGERAFFGYLKAPDRPVYWFDSYQAPGDPPGTIADPVAEADALRARHAGDPFPTAAILAKVTRVERHYPVYDMPRLPGWSRGSVVLVGDSAHAVGPDAGQGASMAIEDALVLAACLEAEPDSSAAFARYESLRRARVDRVVRLTANNQSGKRSHGRLALILRDLILRLVIPIGVRRGRRLLAFRVDQRPLQLPQD